MSSQKYRIERDTLGKVKVPFNALYMAQTQRAVENFPVSGLKFERSFNRALGLIKGAAASVYATSADQRLQRRLEGSTGKALRLMRVSSGG